MFRVGENVQVLDLAKGTTRALGKVDPNHVNDASWNAAGSITFLPASSSSVQLAWVDGGGQDIEAVGEPAADGRLAQSPDGRKVAFEIRDDEGHVGLWVMDVIRGVTSRVTGTPHDERDPVWSPDSRCLAKITRSGEGALLSRKGPRASDPETVLEESSEEYIPEGWSADGRTIMVVQRTLDDQHSI